MSWKFVQSRQEAVMFHSGNCRLLPFAVIFTVFSSEHFSSTGLCLLCCNVHCNVPLCCNVFNCSPSTSRITKHVLCCKLHWVVELVKFRGQQCLIQRRAVKETEPKSEARARQKNELTLLSFLARVPLPWKPYCSFRHLPLMLWSLCSESPSSIVHIIQYFSISLFSHYIYCGRHTLQNT